MLDAAGAFKKNLIIDEKFSHKSTLSPSSTTHEPEFMKEYQKFLQQQSNTNTNTNTDDGVALENENEFKESLKNIHQHFKQQAGTLEENDLFSMFGQNEKMFEEMLSGLCDDVGKEGEFDDLLGDLVQNIISKNVLQEPLSSLQAKYPAWLQCNSSHKDVKLYTQQYVLLCKILNLFDEPNYSEPTHNKLLTTLIYELQELGSPPENFTY